MCVCFLFIYFYRISGVQLHTSIVLRRAMEENLNQVKAQLGTQKKNADNEVKPKSSYDSWKMLFNCKLLGDTKYVQYIFSCW